MRATAAPGVAAARRGRQVSRATVAGASVGVDGYNLLITMESALAGGVLIDGLDGALRDLAGVHGTYRRVDQTIPALGFIVEALHALKPARIDWYLDRPVSNSGRLKSLLADLVEERGGLLVGAEGVEVPGTTPTRWNIELVDSPDRMLADYAGVVITSDSAILDRCARWLNLAGLLVEQHAPEAWRVEFRRTEE
jgi:hypothetical protein